MATASLDVLRDPEVRGEQVRRAGRKRRRGSPRCPPARRCNAGPCRRRPRRTRARRPRPARARTCSDAFLAFGTSYHSGSSPPPPPSTRRSSGQPAAERLAGVGDDRDLHDDRPGACGRGRTCAAARAVAPRWATPAARQANSSTSTAPIPTTSPPATSSGWCIPRYMRAKATKTGSRLPPPRRRRAALGSGIATSAAARGRRRPRSRRRCDRTDSSRRPGGPRAGARAGARAATASDVTRYVADSTTSTKTAKAGDPATGAGAAHDERDHADQDREQRRAADRRADLRASVRKGVRSATIDSTALLSVRLEARRCRAARRSRAARARPRSAASTAKPRSSAAKKTAAGCRPRSRPAKRSAGPPRRAWSSGTTAIAGRP